jgi:hypothetical protein
MVGPPRQRTQDAAQLCPSMYAAVSSTTSGCTTPQQVLQLLTVMNVELHHTTTTRADSDAQIDTMLGLAHLLSDTISTMLGLAL